MQRRIRGKISHIQSEKPGGFAHCVKGKNKSNEQRNRQQLNIGFRCFSESSFVLPKPIIFAPKQLQLLLALRFFELDVIARRRGDKE